MKNKSASGNTTTVKNITACSPPAKKTAKLKAKNQHQKSSYPSIAKMVTAAIKELKDRKGSSVQAIKKYIVSTYKVDGEKFAPFIKRYLKAAVTSGIIVQTKGKGASGSFKLSITKPGTKDKAKRATKKSETDAKKASKKKTTTAKKPAVKKPTTAKKTTAAKKYAAKKPTAAKKTTVEKIPAAQKKTAAVNIISAAIKELNDRKGSSVQAIKKYIVKKYIVCTFKVNSEKLARLVKRYLKAAITSGVVVQTKGKGASGSFKLSTTKPGTKDKVKRATKKSETGAKKASEKKTTTAKKPAVKKPIAAKKTTTEKKSAAQKKTAAAKKRVAAAKQKAAAQTKIFSKTKKAIKAPAKTKTPKPKTAKAAPKTAKATKK